ncbi:hypothetical protein NSB26_14875, partial [Phocaeicola sartorii]|nr:hypothetical protein [Phocaeicola sartorii]
MLKKQDVLMLFHSYCIYMAKHLIFLSEVSASPQTPCSSAFRLKDMHDKSFSRKRSFSVAGKRLRDSILLSVFSSHIFARYKNAAL